MAISIISLGQTKIESAKKSLLVIDSIKSSPGQYVTDTTKRKEIESGQYSCIYRMPPKDINVIDYITPDLDFSTLRYTTDKQVYDRNELWGSPVWYNLYR